MQHFPLTSLDTHIHGSLNTVTAILGRAQMLKRRWIRMSRPMGDSSPDDVNDIELACYSLNQNLRWIHEEGRATHHHLDHVERQLAMIQKLLDDGGFDKVAVQAALNLQESR